MDYTQFLILAPLFAFALFFVVIVVLRATCQKANSRRRDRRANMSTVTISSSDSVMVMEVSRVRSSTSATSPATTNSAVNNTNPSPPGYYSDLPVSATVYPIFVPSYSAPSMSFRDPRQFQGLPGLQAPPPYPPPPSYNQISSFPELPCSIIDLDNSRITRSKSPNLPPVD